jgi:hypothetical protein
VQCVSSLSVENWVSCHARLLFVHKTLNLPGCTAEPDAEIERNTLLCGDSWQVGESFIIHDTCLRKGPSRATMADSRRRDYPTPLTAN